MRNIHILPTKKASRLYLHSNGELQLRYNLSIKDDYLGSNQHLYITNDERIELGDWFYDDDGELFKVTSTYVIDPNTWKDNKKIVLTTDQDLIDDGVQAITNTFAEWFVANPGCKEVEVKKLYKNGYGNWYKDDSHFMASETNYKIILPKEENNSKINLVEIPQEQLEKERNPNYEYFSIDEPKTNLDRLPFPELVEDLDKHYEKEPTTTSDLIDGAMWELPIDDKIKVWKLIEQLVKEETSTLYTEEQVIKIIDKVSPNWYKCYTEEDKKAHLLKIK
jgi:hypothetical protein